MCVLIALHHKNVLTSAEYSFVTLLRPGYTVIRIYMDLQSLSENNERAGVLAYRGGTATKWMKKALLKATNQDTREIKQFEHRLLTYCHTLLDFAWVQRQTLHRVSLGTWEKHAVTKPKCAKTRPAVHIATWEGGATECVALCQRRLRLTFENTASNYACVER